jgi:hypothetical protein
MTKPLGEVRPIAMGETLYQLTTCILYLQFCEAFATQFSPHEFGDVIKGGCETIIHNIRCTLDLHPNSIILQLDVVNAFNLVLKRVIISRILCNR